MNNKIIDGFATFCAITVVLTERFVLPTLLLAFKLLEDILSTPETAKTKKSVDAIPMAELAEQEKELVVVESEQTIEPHKTFDVT